MHKQFDHQEFEKRWQKKWKTDGLYETKKFEKGDKEYLLVEWPYPSGNLHIGHWYAFAVPDIYARYKRMSGKNVIFPMGFDAFGLPAENAAIKNNVSPREWTEKNIAYMRDQLESMGTAFSWDRTTNSIDPDYYKWTQWMFTQFFEHDIAYRGEGVVNWCPGCNTVIANEQVSTDGTCERSGDTIQKRTMPQWMLKITDFADELVDDLEGLDWSEHIKDAQRNWIGRSEGAELSFKLSIGEPINVFTTRPDTLFGVTYLVVAPEHDFLEKNKASISNWDEVASYVTVSKQKNDIERTDNTKEKTGVRLEGITAVNPASGETIPVFVADYVLNGYGTGAIMAVPAHDERDAEFARKFDLLVKRVTSPVINKMKGIERQRTGVYGLLHDEEKGYLLQYFKNQNYYWLPGGGMKNGESEIECLGRELIEETGYADFKILEKIAEPYYDFVGRKGEIGRNKSNVYLVELTSSAKKTITLTEAEVNDGLELVWVKKDEVKKILARGEQSRSELLLSILQSPSVGFSSSNEALINSGEFDGMDSEEAKVAITEKVGGKMTKTYRLRDWSIGRQRYWGVPIPIVYDPEGKAHLVPKEHLPWTLPEDVDFRPTGEAPLAKSKELLERTEKIFGAGWTPEVETMDTFVDSSWYYLRYIDNENDDMFASKENQKDFLPVDLYFGGAEHTTMHLLYSRFWQKALYRLGLVVHKEPYKQRINRGLILGPDGNKMSKSKGNVVNPDEQVKLVGSDTVKMYLAFMGPYQGSNYPWDIGGIAGIHRFLERVNGLSEHITENETDASVALIHKTIMKVGEDIGEFKFNTAISCMMIYLNAAEKEGLSKESYLLFLRVLAPFAPHLTEELWNMHSQAGSIHSQEFPIFSKKLATDKLRTIGVQINGKVRGEITVSPEATEEDVWSAVIGNTELAARIEGVTVVKKIYVPGRIVNIIVAE